jgi:hypothetical protein
VIHTVVAHHLQCTRFMDDTTTKVTTEKTEPLVVALYQHNTEHLAKLVEIRNAARPPGARKVSRSAVVRQLIEEAFAPAAMTEETHAR